MNTLHLNTRLAVACAAAMFATAAFAQQASAPQPVAQATATANSAAAPAPKPAQRPVPAPDSRACIRETGSHIPPPKGQCLPVAGNSYSQQDIQRTGTANIGQALQMLDPSVTIGH